jgi:hypothetical protein
MKMFWRVKTGSKDGVFLKGTAGGEKVRVFGW